MKIFLNSKYPYVTQISNKRIFQSKTVPSVVAVNHWLSEHHTIIQCICNDSSIKLCSSQKLGILGFGRRLMFSYTFKPFTEWNVHSCSEGSLVLCYKTAKYEIKQERIFLTACVSMLMLQQSSQPRLTHSGQEIIRLHLHIPESWLL